MEINKILITDCDHENIDIEREIFTKNSIPFDLLQCKTEEDLIRDAQNAKVLINQYAPFSERVLRELKEAKLIIRYGVGINNIDLHAATNYGIQVCNIPDYGTNEVADHALALMLNLTRKITIMNNHVRKGYWNYQESIPIFRHSNQTVGVIGLGRIGTAFASKVHSLGCKVVAYDPNKTTESLSNRLNFIEIVALEELLEKSDVVSIHCPSDRAWNLIDNLQFERMKQTAYLINVSRGGIVNEEALNIALENKVIAGAAVDVATIEPIQSDSPLLRHENFICTPHMAWYSEQSGNELKRKVAEEAVRFLKSGSDSLNYPVNKLV